MRRPADKSWRPLVALAALYLTACTSFLGAETPQQQFYTAQGMYVIAVEEAVVYARRPDANSSVVAVLKAADYEAHQALVAGRAVLAQVPSGERDQRLVFYANVARIAIARLLEALQEETLQ